MSDNDQQDRDFAKRLFAAGEPDETDEPNEPQKPPGYVANEGRVSEPPPEDPMRALTKALFGHDPNS